MARNSANHEQLSRNRQMVPLAIDNAIAKGAISSYAREWKIVAQLRELSSVLGLRPTALKNSFYRDSTKLQQALLPLLPNRPELLIEDVLKITPRIANLWSSDSIQVAAAIPYARHAYRLIRHLQREHVALTELCRSDRLKVAHFVVECMANIQMLVGASKREPLLVNLHLVAQRLLSPVMLSVDITAEECAVLVRLWHSRPGPGSEHWTSVWDNPMTRPPITESILNLARWELDISASLYRRAASMEANAVIKLQYESLANQQLIDASKWTLKSGDLSGAIQSLDSLPDSGQAFPLFDILAIRTHAAIQSQKPREALEYSNEAAEVTINLFGEKHHISGACAALCHQTFQLYSSNDDRYWEHSRWFSNECLLSQNDIVNLEHLKARHRD